MTEQEIRDDEALRVVAYLERAEQQQRERLKVLAPCTHAHGYHMALIFCLSAIRHNEHRK